MFKFNVGDIVNRITSPKYSEGIIIRVYATTVYVVDWPGLGLMMLVDGCDLELHVSNNPFSVPYASTEIKIDLNLTSNSKPLCECGAHKLKDHGHSAWCPALNIITETIQDKSCNCPISLNISTYRGHSGWCRTQIPS